MADEEQAPAKKSKLKWIILVLLLLLICGGGFVVWKMGIIDISLGGGESSSETADKGTLESKKTTAAPSDNIVALPQFRVNLQDPLGKRFIKLQLDVALSNAQDVKDLEARQAPVRDAIIMILSSKSYSDLATTEGKLNLKSEITARINQVLGGPKVVNIYFTDMVIQ